MGSSTSKAQRAAGTVARKYPARAPPPSTSNTVPRPPPAANHQPGPTVHPQPHAAPKRDEAINLDASDPDFARSLRSLGAVQPNPTQSPSSRFSAMLDSKTPQATNSAYANAPIAAARGGPPVGPDPRMNPALQVLDAREKWQALADREAGEFGRRGFEGRELMDVGTLRRALILRDRRGVGEERIEQMLELKKGTLRRLGGQGVVGVSEMGVD
ncbi:hypothetical protein K461DRAFT_324252 [Myriangium duriaei CBS 260.36]|uniref:Helix-turn-helix domain-containing protein n=1 Tax=Myriangium duriaei CBS 260.36 TaxID=1168546 RepID=A0A9P4IXQ2_9PEZI|nr:hypothetical protein K461DRAFT_324252 [Myriangium duriaei CBS 260.36]